MSFQQGTIRTREVLIPSLSKSETQERRRATHTRDRKIHLLEEVQDLRADSPTTEDRRTLASCVRFGGWS